MITYNHDRYIKEAINGILSQKTNYNYELIISNDCSPDDTDSVIKEIIRVHPEGKRIRYFNQKKNLGITPNFLFTLKEAKGKYIALCEGDDYWTDENKLQAQVDFLENNPTYSGSATQSIIIKEGKGATFENNLFSDNGKTTLTFKDFLGARPFHTASLVFRNNLPLQRFPNNILSADRFLYLLISSFGSINYSSSSTCVYRKNDTGISRRVTSKDLKKDLKMVKILYSLNNNIDKDLLYKFIHKTIINYSNKLFFKDFIRSYFMICFYNLKRGKTNKQELVSLVRNFASYLDSYRKGEKIYV